MMEGEDYTYVGGSGNYKGNILLDPDGYITRAELYDVLAELSHPLEITLQPSPMEVGAMAIVYGGFTLLVVLLACSFAVAIRNRRGRR